MNLISKFRSGKHYRNNKIKIHAIKALAYHLRHQAAFFLKIGISNAGQQGKLFCIYEPILSCAIEFIYKNRKIQG
jgi:hypothetical protein